MKEALNSNTLFNTLAMIRAEKSSVILVVEGDDDLFLIKRHLSKLTILLKGVGGKSAVVETAHRVDKFPIKDVLFLIDADYDRVTAPDREYPGSVVASSNHDVFMDIILANEELLERIVEAHTRQLSRRTGKEIRPSEIVAAAMSLAASLAPLRIVNETESLSLKLVDFPFGSVSSHRPNPREIVSLAVTRSQTQLSVDEVQAKVIEQQSKNIHEQSVLIGDHDLFRSLSRVLALNGVKGVGAETLWTGFLAAADCRHIARTAWFASVKSWSSNRGQTSFMCPCAA